MIDEALAALLSWHAQGRDVALATVIGVTGSAPRQPGAHLAVAGDASMAGSVSGGCVEGAVVQEAQRVLRDGTPRRLHYGISDEMALDVGLMCGGEIDVVVEPADAAILEFARRAEDGEATSRAVALSDFVDRATPPPRLWVVGAGHVAEHVVAIAARAGFRPVVVDPRRLFAAQDRFAGAEVVVAWPDRVFADVELGAADFVVVLSHDPKIDEPALLAALRGEAAYVGAIGSRKAQADRRRRLLADGVGEERLARLHAPIGLDLGGRDPGEIAVAIVAELVSERHRRR